jgi:hypothetical protein
MEKNPKKNPPKNFQKVSKLNSYACNRGSACEKLGDPRPAGLGGDRKCTDMTVHKPKLKFIYRLEKLLFLRHPLRK